MWTDPIFAPFLYSRILALVILFVWAWDEAKDLSVGKERAGGVY